MNGSNRFLEGEMSMSNRASIFVLFASGAFVLASPLLAARTADERATITLESRSLDTRAPLKGISVSLQLAPGARGSEYVLVKFPAPPNAAQLAALDGAAERVYTYLPHDAFLVR